MVDFASVHDHSCFSAYNDLKFELMSFFPHCFGPTVFMFILLVGHLLILLFKILIICSLDNLVMISNNITEMLDSTAGKAQKAQGESLSTFLASLTTSGIILGLGVILYISLKFKLPEY